MLLLQAPIESKLVSALCDHLCAEVRQTSLKNCGPFTHTGHLRAEVSLGTVSSLKEAVVWLSYTYLYVRMCRNPLAYGIPFEQSTHDPRLLAWRTELVQVVARGLANGAVSPSHLIHRGAVAGDGASPRRGEDGAVPRAVRLDRPHRARPHRVALLPLRGDDRGPLGFCGTRLG